MPDSVIRFENVTVAFDGEPAIEDVSFEVLRGESRVLLGAAASGKTVILKTAVGLLQPEQGRVFLFGQDISHLRDQDLFGLRARLGILFQEGALFDSLTVAENVAYPLENQPSVRCPEEEVLKRVTEALRFVELEHTLDKYPSQLSGGMRRRVGIARANVTAPELVLYDSPTAGLDPITANNIMELVVKGRDEHKATTVIVTQRLQDGVIMADYRYNPKTKALERNTNDHEGTKFLVMREGKLVFEGTEDELGASTDPYVSKFAMRH